MRWLKYLWRAFNARPLGMPVPPLWFGLAAAALAGYFIDPAFYFIGAGGTAFLAGMVASTVRFQRAVDAESVAAAPSEQSLLLGRLDERSKETQRKLEIRCSELQRVLEGAKAGPEHIKGVWQLAELHLRLLAAKSAADAVIAAQKSEPGESLSAQIKDLDNRLSPADLDSDLRKALEDQRKILEQRVAIQSEANRRIRVLDAELDRIQDQMALIREQALMTTDPAAIRRSVDALSTFLDESGRWLKDQQEIFGELDVFTPDPFGTEHSGSPLRQRAGNRAGELQ